MIIANFDLETNVAKAEDLWQWDYGQILRIQGLHLPQAVEIHFSLSDTNGESVTRIGVTKDRVTDVTIPDSMLENEDCIGLNYKIFAFIYLTDETSGETIKKIIMSVSTRPKPQPFDTPEDAELFRKAIEEVNAAAKRAEEAEKNAREAEKNAREAESSALSSEESVDKNAKDVANHKEEASGYAGAAKKYAEASEENVGKTASDLKDMKGLVAYLDAIDEINGEPVYSVDELAEDLDSIHGEAI